MSAFITVSRTDTAATHALRLLSLVGHAKSILTEGPQLVAEAFQMFNAEGPTKFDVFAEKMGVSTADAQAVFDMINGMISEMKVVLNDVPTGNAVALSTRIG